MKKPANWQHFPFPTRTETYIFIHGDTPAWEYLAIELWNKSSGYAGLLGARPVASATIHRGKGETDYVYDPILKQYHNMRTGKVISSTDIRMAVARVSNDVQKQMREQTHQLLAGTLMFLIWYNRSRDLLWALYKAVFIVNVGGFLFDNQAMRDLFYLLILAQFERFDEFAMHLGNIPEFTGHEIARAGSYGRYGNPFNQNIILELGAMNGDDQAKRILGPNENHCTDAKEIRGCVELAGLGWIPIRQMTPLGGAVCRAHCLCSIITRKSFAP